MENNLENLEPVKTEKVKVEKVTLPEPTELERSVLNYYNSGMAMDRICALFMMHKSDIEAILNKF
jgi:hypothetical protein